MSERIQNVHPKEYKGITYRSTLEAETAETLDNLNIPFEYEARKITLQEGFRCPYQKKKVIAVTYTPDFLIGPIILECKGFETPEWKLKKKFLFKWLDENEPYTIFYQIGNSRKQLIEALDNHWNTIGYCIEVTSKPSKKKEAVTSTYESIQQAMYDLNLTGKNIGPILRSLTGDREYVYNYNWKLKKMNYD